jgi:hypothetical protein
MDEAGDIGPTVGPDMAVGSVEVQISTPHPATGGPELAVGIGAGIEAAVRALTGGPPAGWGFGEPATQPWSPLTLSAYCQERAPSPTSLVVVAGGSAGRTAVGTVDVRPTSAGLLERVRLAGPANGEVGEDVIDALAEEVAGNARSMIVAVHPGRVDGLRSSRPSLPALPAGILIGHQVVSRQGGEHARGAPAARVTILGSRARPACWCRLDGGDRAPYEVLTAVLEHFGLIDRSR